MAPQIILLMLLAFQVAINLARDGEPRRDKYSFWMSLIGAVITCALLAWGGFFAPMIER